MKVCLDLAGLLSEDDIKTMMKVLNCKDNASLQEAIQGISAAALNEYFEMLLGKQVPNRADEMHERRLLHLLRCYFKERIASEREIASMFQLTETGSRTLLRNTRTKYRFELEDQLLHTIRRTLQSASQHRDGTYHVVVTSDNILEELKRTVSINAPRLEQVSKVRNAACEYSIPEDTFQVLCHFYGVSAVAAQIAASLET